MLPFPWKPSCTAGDRQRVGAAGLLLIAWPVMVVGIVDVVEQQEKMKDEGKLVNHWRYRTVGIKTPIDPPRKTIPTGRLDA